MAQSPLIYSLLTIIVLALVACGTAAGSQPVTTATPATAANPHRIIIDTGPGNTNPEIRVFDDRVEYHTEAPTREKEAR